MQSALLRILTELRHPPARMREDQQRRGGQPGDQALPEQPVQPQQGQREEGQHHAGVGHGFVIVDDGRLAHGQRPAEAGQRQSRPKQPVAGERQPKQAQAEHQNAQNHALWREPRFRPAEQGVVVARQGVRQGHDADAVELPRPEALPWKVLGIAQAGALEHRLDRRKLRHFRLAVQGEVFVGNIEAEHGHAEQQRENAKRQVSSAKQRKEAGSQPGARRSVARRPDVDGLLDQAERNEGQEQRIHMPAEQQRDAGLRQQLPKAAFLGEDHHAVKAQHQPQHVQPPLGGDHVARIQPPAG